MQFIYERACLRAWCTLALNWKPFEFAPQASEILSGLYLSDIYTATSPQMIDDLGITHILSLFPQHFDYGSRFKSLWLPIHSPGSRDDLLHLLPTTTYFLKGAMSDRPDGQSRILICCPLGVQDGPAIAIGYLIAQHHISFKDAYRQVRLVRPVVSLSLNAMRQLLEWENRTREEIEKELEFRTRAISRHRRCTSRIRIPMLTVRANSC